MTVDGGKVIAGVDQHAGRRVVDKVIQLVGILHVDQGDHCPQAPRPEHRQQIVKPIVRKNANPVAPLHIKRRQRPGYPFHRGHGFGIGQRPIPFDPAQGRGIGRPLRPGGQ